MNSARNPRYVFAVLRCLYLSSKKLYQMCTSFAGSVLTSEFAQRRPHHLLVAGATRDERKHSACTAERFLSLSKTKSAVTRLLMSSERSKCFSKRHKRCLTVARWAQQRPRRPDCSYVQCLGLSQQRAGSYSTQQRVLSVQAERTSHVFFSHIRSMCKRM